MALPTKQRLKLTGDFRAVSRAKSFQGGKLLLKAKPSSQNKSRFGIVISKTVAKKAVDRNRMRRLLTEALKTKQGSLKGSYDIILVALPGFSLKDLSEAKSSIENLFHKAFLKTSS